MPPMPEGAADGILRGLYKFQAAVKTDGSPRVHLFGSGPLLNEALRAQGLLREKYGVAADVWSATSYNELYRDALTCQRWNRLHPEQPPRVPYVAQPLRDEPWPIVASSDFVTSVAAGLTVLGTDGFGRSDTRASLRRHFETDAEHIALAALTALARAGKFDAQKLPGAIKDLGVDPEAPNPATA